MRVHACSLAERDNIYGQSRTCLIQALPHAMRGVVLATGFDSTDEGKQWIVTSTMAACNGSRRLARSGDERAYCMNPRFAATNGSTSKSAWIRHLCRQLENSSTGSRPTSRNIRVLAMRSRSSMATESTICIRFVLFVADDWMQVL